MGFHVLPKSSVFQTPPFTAAPPRQKKLGGGGRPARAPPRPPAAKRADAAPAHLGIELRIVLLRRSRKPRHHSQEQQRHPLADSRNTHQRGLLAAPCYLG